MTTNVAPVVTVLEKALADTYALALKTQNYHWNVTGADFHQFHGMFEEQYTELHDAVDELAERIRALGQRAPGGFKAFQDLTQIQDGDGTAAATDMIKDLAQGHEAIAALTRAGIETAEEAGDAASADLLTERQAAHQKAAWMLNATVAR